MPRILCLVLKQHSHNPSSLKTVHRTVLSTLTFSPDLAVNLDKKENRVVKRLLCCGSPNWARTSDIMINSHALSTVYIHIPVKAVAKPFIFLL